MSVAFQLPRSTRRTDYVAAPGQTVFGPAPWLAFAGEDVVLRRRAVGATRWVVVASGATVALSASPAGFPSATFAVAQTGFEIRLEGRRVHPRISDVTRAGSLQTALLERELDAQASVLQELRRDADESLAIGDANGAELETHEGRLDQLGEDLLAAVAGLSTPLLSDFAYAPDWPSASPTTVKARLDSFYVDLQSQYGVSPARTAAQNTARLQAALDDHAGSGRTLLLPRGVVKHLGLDVVPPLRLIGHGKSSSVLFLENGANRSSFSVAYVPRGIYFQPKHFDLEDLQVHGNRTEQTSGWLIDLEDGGTDVSGTAYGWSVRTRSVMLVSGKEGGINFRNNRNGAVLGPGTHIQFCDGDGVRINASGDMRFLAIDIDGCLGEGVNDVAGFAVIIENCNIYSNNIGVRVQAFAQDIIVLGGSIDLNGRQGVSLEGGLARNQRVIYATNFGMNSQAGAGTYSDIYCLDNYAAQIVGTAHNHRGTGHKPKYLIEFSGTCALHQFAPLYDPGDNPWSTALTNGFDKLLSAGNLDSYFGPRGGLGTLHFGIRGYDMLKLYANSGAVLSASQQYSGLRLQTPAGVAIADLRGLAADNKGGGFLLFNADGSVGQEIYAPDTGVPTQIQFPGPYANDAAAQAAGVKVGRTYRKSDGSIVARTV